jgi:hypothetical protein
MCSGSNGRIVFAGRKVCHRGNTRLHRRGTTAVAWTAGVTPPPAGAEGRPMINRTVKVTIGMCCLAGFAVAQRGGPSGGRAAMAPSRGHATASSGPEHGRPPYDGWGSGKLAYGHTRHSRAWSQPLSPTGYFDSASASAEPAEGSAAVPTVYVVMQPRAERTPEPPPVPESPVRPAIREYSWPSSSASASAPFAIILKDGTARTAIALCRQESRLTYVAPGGSVGAVDVSEVDRDATRRANSTDLLH